MKGDTTYVLHNIYGGFGEDRPRTFEDLSPTIRTPKGGGHLPVLVDGVKIRRFTPIECERLQGFPDDWTRWARINGKKVEPSDTQRYKMMGNAVTVNVVEAVGRRWR